MKYLCLVYGAESADEDHRSCIDGLSDGDQFLAGDLLAGDHASTRVCLRQGRVAILDEAEAAAPAPLAAFFLLQARDLNEAILLASAIPLSRVEWVDIRPVRGGC